MSYQQQEFTAPGGPVRRESALQRQMAEFDAKKAGSTRNVSYSEGTNQRDGSTSPSGRKGTPHPKAGGPHAPPSPGNEQGYVSSSRNNNQSPPRSDDESEYIKNIRKTGGNGRDTEEKWVGNGLPRPRTHGGDDEADFSHADNIRVKGGTKGKDQVQEWNGSEAPRITHHHTWTEDEPQFAREAGDDEDAAPRKKSSPKSKKYKNKDGDYVEEAEGSDNEIGAHHQWRPDSEAQANYKPEKSKKSKKSSRRSSQEENRYEHSGDESQEFSAPPRTKTYIDRNGDEVQEAADPDNLKIGHNHTWTD